VVKFYNDGVRGPGGNWNLRVTFAYPIYTDEFEFLVSRSV